MRLRWDVFISYASEDRHAVAEPLAEELATRGFQVWYDASQLSVGDSLRQKVDDGLQRSRAGIVVLSPAFFKRAWPRRELEILLEGEARRSTIVTAVLYSLSDGDMRRHSDLLLGRPAVKWDPERVRDSVDRIEAAIRPAHDNTHSHDPPLSPRSKLPEKELCRLATRLTTAPEAIEWDFAPLDDCRKAMERLVEDGSIPAAELLFANAIETGSSDNLLGMGDEGLMELGDAAAPWIARLLKHGSDSVVRGMFSSLVLEGCVSDEAFRSRQERVVASLVERRSWYDVEKRLLEAVADSHELEELLALGRRIASLDK